MKPDLDRTGKILLGLFLILITAILNYSHLTQKLDNFMFDSHLNFWSRAASEDIVLVTIDDRSVDQLGRWPWPRRFHAKLLEALEDSKAVSLDIIFSENDTNDSEGDQILAKAISKHGKIVLPVALTTVSSEILKEGVPVLSELKSLPVFDREAAGRGHVDVELEDGISRSIFLKGGMNIPTVSALPLAMIELYDQIEIPGQRNTKLEIAKKDRDKIERINRSAENNLAENKWIKNKWVRDYRILLPFPENPQHFKKISYIDALDHQFDRNIFTDKWVLVGMDVTGLSDRIPTPVTHSAQSMAGVEFEAHVLDILLNDLSIQPLNDHQNFLLSLPFLIALVLLLHFFRAEKSWLATLLPVLAIIMCCLLLSRSGFLGTHFWFRPGSALVALFIGYILLHRQQLAGFLFFLRQEKEHAEVALSTVSNAVVITDNLGSVAFMNPVAERLTGYAFKEVRGQPLSDVVQFQDHNGEPSQIDLFAKSQSTQDTVDLPENYFLKQQSGRLLAVKANAKPFAGDEKENTGVVVAFDQENLQQLQTTDVIDTLTGLPASSLLNDRLKHAISIASRTKRLIAVLYLDIDNFKKITDGVSTKNVESLLKEAASRLTARGRSCDTVARIEDANFVVVLENLEDVDSVASVAMSLLDVLGEPFRIMDRAISVERNIGISIYPKDGLDADTLKKNALIAMHRARKSQKENTPQFRFYSQEMNKTTLNQMLSKKDLRTALTEDNFELYYQPRLDLRTGKIVTVEALIRWRRKTEDGEELLLPGSFIPLAERCGLISEIGSWVLETACLQAKKWQETGFQHPRMAINLSDRQFLQHDLLDTIARVLDKLALEPQLLELEISESTLLRNADRCIEILKEFRAVGGKVSIDDFGADYSSLSYLESFPVDTLKIDKVFIDDVLLEKEHQAITLAVISMAHSLNLRVVAQGVEAKPQFDFLRGKGCDELQGDYFSKPLSAFEMTKMLEKNQDIELEDIFEQLGHTLLLVDEDNETLSRTGMMLANEGYQILMANSAEHALNLLAKHTVGVVVCEAVVRQIQGDELLEKIKSLYPETTCVLQMGSTDRKTTTLEKESVVISKFITKPISELEFKDLLRKSFNPDL
ncbi:MAG: EAL domain-containing protein [Gammaproteobacteria bacterium]